MNKKSFILGFFTGVIVTFIGIFILGKTMQNPASQDSIQYLENPVSYENKEETSFKVFQVLGDLALANEVSSAEFNIYNGNTVVILGENYYNDQVVKIKNPQRIGSYSYTTRSDMPMTVPVVDGEKE